MKVIGLMGAKRSGKDYFCSVIKNEFPDIRVQRFAFADQLRLEIASSFPVSYDVLVSDAFKEAPIKELALQFCTDPKFIKAMMTEYPNIDIAEPRSPRWTMQRWGTEYRRSQNLMYWIEPFYRSYENAIQKNCKALIVTDVRFSQEIQAIENCHGQFVGIRNRSAEAKIDIYGHMSELIWMHYPDRFDIWNLYPEKGSEKFKSEIIAFFKRTI